LKNANNVNSNILFTADGKQSALPLGHVSKSG